MALLEDGKLVYMYVSRSMFNRYKLGLDVTEGFINYARSIDGIKVAMIFLEHPSKRNHIQII